MNYLLIYSIYLGCVLNMYAAHFPLHEAAAHGDLERIKTLYQTHKDLNLLNENGYTVLYQAAGSGNLDVVQFLVDNGAGVNGANSSDIIGHKIKNEDRGATPFHIAARKGFLDIVRFLHSKGADIEAKSRMRYYTPLGEAARSGRQEVIQFLVNTNAYNSGFLMMAAHRAHWNGHYRLEQYLIKKEHTANTLNQEPVYKALREGNLQEVQNALALGIDKDVQDKEGRTLLHHAVYEDRPDIVKFLLEKGANVRQEDKDNKTPFTMQNGFDRTFVHELARKGDLAFLTLLIENYGAEINIQDKDGSPLNGAAEENQIEVVTWLLQHGANYSLAINDRDNMTPLHVAAKQGNSEIIKLFIEQHGVDVNPITRLGMTPLHYAARRGDLALVKLLLAQHGVNASQQDEKGRTALLHAAQSGNVELVNFLLHQEGVELLQHDKNGRTCLHHAAKAPNDAIELITFLLQKRRFKPHQLDKKGWRPVDYAARLNNLEIVKYLSQQEGFDINLRTGKHKSLTGSSTLLYKAVGKHALDVIDFLLQQPGIDVDAPAWKMYWSFEKSKSTHYNITPLQLVTHSYNDTKIIVTMLLDAGANLYKKDGKGYSALSNIMDSGVDQATLCKLKEKAAAAAKKKEIALPIQALENDPEEEHSNSALYKMMPLIIAGTALSLGLTTFYFYKKWRSRAQPDQNKSKKEDQADVEKSESLWET